MLELIYNKTTQVYVDILNKYVQQIDGGIRRLPNFQNMLILHITAIDQ